MAEKFDRSKFKGAKLSKLKETKAEAEKKDVRLLGGQGGGRANFHNVDEGRNEFRIFPPHDPVNEPAYRAVRTSTLQCELPVYEDGKETNKVETRGKKIFIATQHGNDDLKRLGKDPIELYIKYVGELAGAIDDKDERQKFLAPIKGWRGKDGKWNWGIMPSTSYVCYASKDNSLGRLELWDSWVKEMDKITALIEEEEDEITDKDPFSDPDEGYPLVVKKEKNEKGKWSYIVDRVNPKKRQTWDEFCEDNRITDEQLKELFEKESLTDLYTDCYTMRDFDLALNGLRMFDKKYKFEVFENEDFLTELEEIKKVVPEPEDKDSDIDKAFEAAKNAETATWPKIKCKKYLRAYILENYEEEGEDYLQAIEKLSIEELRVWCALGEEGEELPALEGEESTDTDSNDGIEAPEDSESEEGSTEDDELKSLLAGRSRRGSK